MKEQEIKKVCKCEGTIELTPEGRCRKCFGIINYPFKEQELIKRIEKEFVEKTKGKSMSTSDEERLLISISIQQAKSEVIKEFEKILKIDFDEQWIQYYKLDGGKIGVDEKMKINLERVKQKLKDLK